jgi:predicted nucleotidyltransferase
MSAPNLGAMRAVAERLDRVGLAYAFVGGSVVNLLLDHPELSPARPTDDVDVIIDLISGARYSEVEAKLRGVGFSHDMTQGAPKCRWTLGGVTVDIMPTDGAGLGLNTAWFAEALATATPHVVAHSEFRIVSPVAFLATKYTAFLDRGGHDYYGSHDLEDFMTVSTAVQVS